jgi:hypothetical protein
MAKLDFKKELDSYRARRDVLRIVDVPDTDYLMIDGTGDPNTSQSFTDSIEALYPLAYALKFASKIDLGRDYVVPPLEGLWWADDMNDFTVSRNKSRWKWTLMIMVPEWVEQPVFDVAVAKASSKNTRCADVRRERLSEGRCVQTLHVGAFDDEAPLLRRMHDEFVPEHGLSVTGKHHEIYLSDFRRTAPEARRTILRQPVTAP